LPASRKQSAAVAPLLQLRAALHATQDSEEPRHLRLRTALLELMARGAWAPGDQLPPEREIAATVGLSLGTVQKALDRLAASHVLDRRHGHGTFVSAGTQAAKLLHFRFVGDDGQVLSAVYAEALDRKLLATKGPWSEFLAPAKRFVRVRRRLNVAGEFDCLSEFYVDGERFAALMSIPFEELDNITLRSVLAQRFNRPTLSLRQHAYACEFPEGVARTLKMPKARRFGLVLEVFSYTHHEEPVSFQRIHVPAGVRHLEIPSPQLRST